MTRHRQAVPYAENIRQSGFDINDKITIGDAKLWIPTPDLERILNQGLRGLSLAGLPLRTRSKFVRQHICRVLGYPVPASFRKARPKFAGQQFDTYIQKANNLQVWNEDLSPTRRYVLVRPTQGDLIGTVKVVTGDVLAGLDKTRTLTTKYQARCVMGQSGTQLVTPQDTALLHPLVTSGVELRRVATPVSNPVVDELLPIAELYRKLSKLVGQTFNDVGSDQERNRGGALHRLVCTALGYASYQDNGQFPDVRHQLLEVKLQSAPTINLGLVLPSSAAPLDVPMMAGRQVRHCDVRYAVFYATMLGSVVTLTQLLLTTGEGFFGRFVQFQGKVLNKKLQISLPRNFFGDAEGFPD